MNQILRKGTKVKFLWNHHGYYHGYFEFDKKNTYDGIIERYLGELEDTYEVWFVKNGEKDKLTVVPRNDITQTLL